MAGVPPAQLGSVFDTSGALGHPTASAAAIIRLLADAIEAGHHGLIISGEQATISVAELVLDAVARRF